MKEKLKLGSASLDKLKNDMGMPQKCAIITSEDSKFNGDRKTKIYFMYARY
jgi:hypothetical protein